jgi:hypothetical protein
LKKEILLHSTEKTYAYIFTSAEIRVEVFDLYFGTGYHIQSVYESLMVT